MQRTREVSSNLVAQILFADTMVPVAHPTLIKKPIKNHAELSRSPLSHDERPEGWNEWFESAGGRVEEIAAGLDFSNSDLALQAALLAMELRSQAFHFLQDLLSKNQLCQVFLHNFQTGHSWYAVSTEKELSEPVTQNMWDWLTEASF
jgi:LysR family transcriptional regulator, glycine cleavage system transcriptional activator